MKISHEVPYTLMNESLEFNDYDYALVHLFEQNENYFQFYYDSIHKRNRVVLIDNSVFELGKAFDTHKFIDQLFRINPTNTTEFVIPDSLSDMRSTLRQMDEFLKILPKDVKGKKIGVVQGNSKEDIITCYKHMSEDYRVDKIAINFTNDVMSQFIPINVRLNKSSRYLSIRGRYYFIKYLIENDLINNKKPHHLLGCVLPQEFSFYKDKKRYGFIESCDTSNPVVHGIHGIKYSDNGLEEKLNIKLVDIISTPMDVIDRFRHIIYHNIYTFKQFCE